MQLTRLESSILNNIKITYSLDTLELYKISNNYELLVYFVKTDNLDSHWEEINSSLTQGLDEYLDGFNKWNMYLFFVTEDDITKELQYKIENDTLAFRKITESNYDSEINEENIKSLISKHILFTDLGIDSTSVGLENYNSETNTWANIVSIDELNDENIDSILVNLEGEINED